MKLNFLRKLIDNLAPEVFKPIPTGILYTFLQAFSREISGECPFDTGEGCWKNYTTYWYVKCRNHACPGYLHPTGVIAYTSRSNTINTSVDDRFDYSSIRYLAGDGNDWCDVGSLGAKIDFGFLAADAGGWGASYYGAYSWGYNPITGGGALPIIGDSWTLACTASTGLVGPAVPNPANTGIYSSLSTSGTYTGTHDTTYTVTIIDFWGYVQNFENALLQISLSDCTDDWLDYWGEYFGLYRLLLTGGYEDDETYRLRIMKEITRAKGTKPVLLEEAKNYFNSDLVTITEYHQDTTVTPYWDGPVTNPADDAYGLWPWQFYINLPTEKSPSSKFVKVGSTLEESATSVYVYEGGYGYYYGYGAFSIIGSGSPLFSLPPSVGDATLYGCATKFSGVALTFLTPGVGGTYVWEYWNGSSWTAFISGTTIRDTTTGLTAGGGLFWLVPESGWEAADNVPYNIPSTGSVKYWVRCRVTAIPTTTPVVNVMTILHVGSTNRGHYVGATAAVAGHAAPLYPGIYDYTLRDKNNVYIYDLIGFEKPVWESGLQDIIDRIKTAGTIAIINPRD